MAFTDVAVADAHGRGWMPPGPLPRRRFGVAARAPRDRRAFASLRRLMAPARLGALFTAAAVGLVVGFAASSAVTLAPGGAIPSAASERAASLVVGAAFVILGLVACAGAGILGRGVPRGHRAPLPERWSPVSAAVGFVTAWIGTIGSDGNRIEVAASAGSAEVVAFVELWVLVNLLSAVLAVSACLFYVFIYTLLLKRRTSQNVVWGGAAGCMPVMIGWSAVTGTIQWPALVMFLIIFFWTPPHTWALAMRYKDDYKAAGVPILPVVATEVVLTAFFLFVILGASAKRAAVGFSGVAIGLTLTLIHLVSIPVSNTSVNPARSTGPALVVGGLALQPLHRLRGE